MKPDLEPSGHQDALLPNKKSSRWKRIWIGVIGGTVLIFGIALIVLPGPAFIVIPAGLAILATEFAWAGHWLKKAREFYMEQKGKFKRREKPARGKLK